MARTLKVHRISHHKIEYGTLQDPRAKIENRIWSQERQSMDYITKQRPA
jgi:hypothetical protein